MLTFLYNLSNMDIKSAKHLHSSFDRQYSGFEMIQD